MKALAERRNSARPNAELSCDLKRLKANVAQTAATDFFGADGREPVDGLIAGLEAASDEEGTMTQPGGMMRQPTVDWAH